VRERERLDREYPQRGSRPNEVKGEKERKAMRRGRRREKE
jgi:hypothetical protein